MTVVMMGSRVHKVQVTGAMALIGSVLIDESPNLRYRSELAFTIIYYMLKETKPYIFEQTTDRMVFMFGLAAILPIVLVLIIGAVWIHVFSPTRIYGLAPEGSNRAQLIDKNLVLTILCAAILLLCATKSFQLTILILSVLFQSLEAILI